MVFDPTPVVLDMNLFERQDWSYSPYGCEGLAEELPNNLVGNSVLRFRFLGLPEFGIPLPSSEFRNFPAENQIGKPENRSSRKSEFRFPFSGIPEFR
jgi:hypothetical protein